IGFLVLLPCPLFAELLLFLADLVPDALQPGPQRRQHCLLAFQRRRTLVDLRPGCVLLLFLLCQPLGFLGQFVVPVIELSSLLLQLARVALELLIAFVHLHRMLPELLLALLHLPPKPVEAEQVLLELSLPLLHRLALFSYLPFAALAVLAAAGDILLDLL